MNRLTDVNTIARLTAIKREELDRYRQDLVRLEKIVDGERNRLQAAREAEIDFLDEARRAEVARRTLDARAMIERRRYLTLLQNSREKQQTVLEQTIKQRDQAQRCLEAAFTEIRSLERLAERRLDRIHSENQRLEYKRADDLELTNNMHRRSTHA